MSAVVVTSENSAEFYAKKLDLMPEPPVVPEKDNVGSETGVESAEKKPEAAEPEGGKPDPEKIQRFNGRFSDLTKERDEAKARADKLELEAKSAREAREAAERRVAELQARYEPPKTEPDPEPKREQFVNDEEFLKARDEWAGEKAVREKETKDREAAKVKGFLDRLSPFKAEHPDYEAKISAVGSVAVSNEVRDAIYESEWGPQILYHLAENPAEIPGITGRKIGRLEAKFEAEAKPKTEPKSAPAAPEISRAPAPISPLKASSSTPEVPIDTKGEFVGNYATWKRLRKEGKIK